MTTSAMTIPFGLSTFSLMSLVWARLRSMAFSLKRQFDEAVGLAWTDFLELTCHLVIDFRGPFHEPCPFSP